MLPRPAAVVALLYLLLLTSTGISSAIIPTEIDCTSLALGDVSLQARLCRDLHQTLSREAVQSSDVITFRIRVNGSATCDTDARPDAEDIAATPLLAVVGKTFLLLQHTEFVTSLHDEWSDAQCYGVAAVCCVIAAVCKWKSWKADYGSKEEQAQQASICNTLVVLGCVLLALTAKTILQFAISACLAVTLIVLQPSYRTFRYLRMARVTTFCLFPQSAYPAAEACMLLGISGALVHNSFGAHLAECLLIAARMVLLSSTNSQRIQPLVATGLSCVLLLLKLGWLDRAAATARETKLSAQYSALDKFREVLDHQVPSALQLPIERLTLPSVR